MNTIVILAAGKKNYGKGSGRARDKEQDLCSQISPEVWKGVAGGQNSCCHLLKKSGANLYQNAQTAQMIRSSITVLEPCTWGRECGNISTQTLLFVKIGVSLQLDYSL